MPRKSLANGEDTTTRWREKVQGSHILNRLIACAEGVDYYVAGNLIEAMTHTESQVALRLVDKILPSLASVQVEQTVVHIGLQRHELDARLLALGQDPNKIWNRLGGVIDVEPIRAKLVDQDNTSVHVDKHDQNQQPIEGTTPDSTESESSS
jgi:hypothetical protein